MLSLTQVAPGSLPTFSEENDQPTPIYLIIRVYQWWKELKVNCTPLSQSYWTAHIITIRFPSFNVLFKLMNSNPQSSSCIVCYYIKRIMCTPYPSLPPSVQLVFPAGFLCFVTCNHKNIFRHQALLCFVYHGLDYSWVYIQHYEHPNHEESLLCLQRYLVRHPLRKRRNNILDSHSFLTKSQQPMLQDNLFLPPWSRSAQESLCHRSHHISGQVQQDLHWRYPAVSIEALCIWSPCIWVILMKPCL